MVLDAFSQFSQNPTSMSAGYGIESNYPLIGENLKKRYKIGKILVEEILTFLKESFEEMKKIEYSVDFWREAIADYIKEKYMKTFLDWYDDLFAKLNKEEKQQFLFLLWALHYTTSSRSLLQWFCCFFDKEEKLSESDVENLCVQRGLGNMLYYRSSGGYEEYQLVPFHSLDILRERFKGSVPINEGEIENFFNNLLIGNVKLLERCLKEAIPIVENRMGRITQTLPLIVESSKSYFAISPFALDKFRELIKTKKFELTNEWKERLNRILNSFVKDVYPCAELKILFETEGAYCWEIVYADNPEKEPIKVGFLLSPYLFITSGYSTILNKMEGMLSSHLNLIFLIKETLPAITESFRYVNQRNLIFLLDETGEKFYLVERSQKLPEEKALTVDDFLSRLFPVLEKELKISKTWPYHLNEYLENLKYYNQFPRLFYIQNRIRDLQPKLRAIIREKLEGRFGAEWKKKIKEKLPSGKVEKFESIIQKRPDKEEAKDFLDGATLGELVEILRSFSDALGIEKSEIVHLDVISNYRKLLEHPLKELKDRKNDIDKKTYKMLKIALDYIEEVICLK